MLSRFATEVGISTITFVTWRALLGALILIVSVALALGFGLIRSVRFADVPPKHWLQISTVAILNVVINLAVFTGFEYASIALVLICFYTYPVIVAVAATRVYHEPLTGLRVGALALASAGLVLVVVVPMLGQGDADVSAIGLLLGLLAAVAQAVHSLIAGRGYSSLPAPQAAAALSVIQAIGFVGVALLAGAASTLTEPFAVEGAWVWIDPGGHHRPGDPDRSGPGRLPSPWSHAGLHPHAARAGGRGPAGRRAARRAAGPRAAPRWGPRAGRQPAGPGASPAGWQPAPQPA